MFATTQQPAIRISDYGSWREELENVKDSESAWKTLFGIVAVFDSVLEEPYDEDRQLHFPNEAGQLALELLMRGNDLAKQEGVEELSEQQQTAVKNVVGLMYRGANYLERVLLSLRNGAFIEPVAELIKETAYTYQYLDDTLAILLDEELYRLVSRREQSLRRKIEERNAEIDRLTELHENADGVQRHVAARIESVEREVNGTLDKLAHDLSKAVRGIQTLHATTRNRMQRSLDRAKKPVQKGRKRQRTSSKRITSAFTPRSSLLAPDTWIEPEFEDDEPRASRKRAHSDSDLSDSDAEHDDPTDKTVRSKARPVGRQRARPPQRGAARAATNGIAACSRNPFADSDDEEAAVIDVDALPSEDDEPAASEEKQPAPRRSVYRLKPLSPLGSVEPEPESDSETAVSPKRVAVKHTRRFRAKRATTTESASSSSEPEAEEEEEAPATPRLSSSDEDDEAPTVMTALPSPEQLSSLQACTPTQVEDDKEPASSDSDEEGACLFEDD